MHRLPVEAKGVDFVAISSTSALFGADQILWHHAFLREESDKRYFTVSFNFYTYEMVSIGLYRGRSEVTGASQSGLKSGILVVGVQDKYQVLHGGVFSLRDDD